MMRSLIVYFSRTEVAHFRSNREEGDTRPFSMVQASGVPPLVHPGPAEGESIMAGDVRSERSPATPGGGALHSGHLAAVRAGQDSEAVTVTGAISDGGMVA